MTKHAILIGVNSVPGMDYLSAPVDYAIKMRKWAISQDYKTSLFIDDPNSSWTAGPCTRSAILKEIHRAIVEGTDQLLIYFSGHGIQRTAATDIWLLPGYDPDPSDCINLTECKALAFKSGVPHIVFISDACRAPSDQPALQAAMGGTIIPNMDRFNPKMKVDILYSTWPGHFSVDIMDMNNQYISVYSENLLHCLNGHVPEVIRHLMKCAPGFPAVMADELNCYLQDVVPQKMMEAKHSPQFPMGEVTSRDPHFLASFKRLQPGGEGEENIHYKVFESEPRSEEHSLDDRLDSYKNSIGDTDNEKVHNIMRESTLGYDTYYYSGIFDAYRTSFGIVGADDLQVFSNSRIIFWNDSVEQKRYDITFIDNVQAKDPAGLMLVASNGRNRFYPFNIINGFYTELVFDGKELLTVNYYPLARRPKSEKEFHQLRNQKVSVIEAAKKGIFLSETDLGKYLYDYWNPDPTIALFAAYAMFRKGNYAEVKKILRKMGNPSNLGGDLKLLNLLSDTKSSAVDRGMISLPVLTEGWSYLNMLEGHPYGFLSTKLEQGLWTSFNEEGMDFLFHELKFRPRLW